MRDTTNRQLTIPVSLGELADRVCILAIKAERMRDPAKRARALRQHGPLAAMMAESGLAADNEHYLELMHVNQELWELEDEIRVKDRLGEHDTRFVEIARRIRWLNDRRHAVKRIIDEERGSVLLEDKEYSFKD